MNTTIKAEISMEFNVLIPGLNSAFCLKACFSFPVYRGHFKYRLAFMKYKIAANPILTS